MEQRDKEVQKCTLASALEYITSKCQTIFCGSLILVLLVSCSMLKAS